MKLRREDNGASRFFSTARARNGRRRWEIRRGPHVTRDSRRPVSRLLLRDRKDEDDASTWAWSRGTYGKEGEKKRGTRERMKEELGNRKRK